MAMPNKGNREYITHYGELIGIFTFCGSLKNSLENWLFASEIREGFRGPKLMEKYSSQTPFFSKSGFGALKLH